MSTPTPLREHGTTTPSEGRSALLDRIWALGRIGLGWTFLWAFLDKVFGLGFSTPSDRSWLSGGSPTEGFLANSAAGPFQKWSARQSPRQWCVRSERPPARSPSRNKVTC